MSDYRLPLSKTPIRIQIVVAGILVLVACIFATTFFNRVVTLAPHLQGIFLTALWIVLPVLWFVGSVVILKKWPKTTYLLTPSALQISKKGWFGAYSEELYRYESILSVSSSISSFGPYGTLKLTLSRLDPITIHAVINPTEQAHKIKAMVAKGQPKIKTIAD